MSKANNKIVQLRRAVIACQKRISKERDILRDLMDDAGQIEEDCSEAVGYLSSAADKLSELQ